MIPIREALKNYPECYNSTIFGPSGNITVNGTLTCPLNTDATVSSLRKRGSGAGKQQGADLNAPPYAIHNGNGRLSTRALATNATHAEGQVELDVHNLWGMMEEKAAHLALQDAIPSKRPFVNSRSTFPSLGRWTGHWVPGRQFQFMGYLRYSIASVLQFQIFQIPFVGADTCGFNGNTDEELCNRWMQLAAFTSFYRNHNIKGAISQEPYRWVSIANASRMAIGVRYSLLPYWYTLLANASTSSTPPVRALFYKFPNEPELFGVNSQFLAGGDILVTPDLDPNVTTVSGNGAVLLIARCDYIARFRFLPAPAKSLFYGGSGTGNANSACDSNKAMKNAPSSSDAYRLKLTSTSTLKLDTKAVPQAL
ncbi:glycosyl hydrolases family 31-domain-containing protein [Pholiota molesta]|nr:glycosyl hydrolases family 31-domain-containing protein [Pholiota molesta]